MKQDSSTLLVRLSFHSIAVAPRGRSRRDLLGRLVREAGGTVNPWWTRGARLTKAARTHRLLEVAQKCQRELRFDGAKPVRLRYVRAKAHTASTCHFA